MPITSPHGSWRSPITSELIVAESVSLQEPKLSNGTAYWLEGRPREGGRTAVVSSDRGDLLAAPLSARSRVHEYGGGAYLPTRDGLFFCEQASQQVYWQSGLEHKQITNQPTARFADFQWDPRRRRLIAVREMHSEGAAEPVNDLVSLSVDRQDDVLVLAGGADFYASPRLHPSGEQIAWLTWRHPNMPWVSTELWVGQLSADGRIDSATQIAGGPDESVFQPEWSPAGDLYFVSDRSGWWNLYRWRNGQAEPLAPRDAEFGQPQWVFGMSTYAFAGPDRIVCTYNVNGVWKLGLVQTESGEWSDVATTYSDISSLSAEEDTVLFRGGAPDRAPAIVRLSLKTGREEVLRTAFSLSDEVLPYLSRPQAIEFPTANGLTAHAFYYPPSNPEYRAAEGARPPLLVKSHGGPTAAATSALDLRTQFWTSRGFAVVDVNYGGSTGFGREYRFRLAGTWGEVDLQDCTRVAQYLVEEGLADPGQLAITGGSAGGFTTLSALTFGKTFQAGASYYGVSDLEGLVADTHKFESRYLDWLVGPYPEQKELYRQRSPLHAVDQLSVPVAFFQGEEDRVVPPNQTERMVEALKAKGLPFVYLLFAGEQHGFRKATTIQRALDAELQFYAAFLLREGLRY